MSHALHHENEINCDDTVYIMTFIDHSFASPEIFNVQESIAFIQRLEQHVFFFRYIDFFK